jgi:hypothetical protein
MQATAPTNPEIPMVFKFMGSLRLFSGPSRPHQKKNLMFVRTDIFCHS